MVAIKLQTTPERRKRGTIVALRGVRPAESEMRLGILAAGRSSHASRCRIPLPCPGAFTRTGLIERFCSSQAGQKPLLRRTQADPSAWARSVLCPPGIWAHIF